MEPLPSGDIASRLGRFDDVQQMEAAGRSDAEIIEVLQAAVGNHFRDRLQSMPAIRFIEQRQQVQEDALAAGARAALAADGRPGRPGRRALAARRVWARVPRKRPAAIPIDSETGHLMSLPDHPSGSVFFDQVTTTLAHGTRLSA